MAAVENVPSGAKWSTGFPKGILDVPGFKGCCGGFMKFSYVVSAPLHMKGFFEFWESSRASWADRIAVTIDLLVHLALWFVALGLEIWVNTQTHKGHALLSELALASLWALIVALIGIVIAQVFAMTAGGQEAGRLFPTTYGAIVGGAYASIVFSILWAITQVSVWPELSAQYTDSGPGSDDDALKIQRHMVLWAMSLKMVAVVTLAKNASFWGPCVVDEQQSASDQKSQYMKQMGVTSTGALAAQIGGV
jgi:hypothetical protein